MGNFAIFLIFGMILFSLSLIGYDKYKITTLYALAIGGVVNANFFQANLYPIYCFGLPFGIDSLIYTLFAFCVMVVLIQDSKKDAYLLALSSIVAILFSASMQLIAESFSQGISSESFSTFFDFVNSIFSSIISTVASVEIVSLMKKKNSNKFVCMAVGVSILSLMNCFIHFGLLALSDISEAASLVYFYASLFGRMLGVGFSVMAFFFLHLRDKSISAKRKPE